MNNLIQIAKDLIDEANSKGIDLKAFGRIGVAISCGLKDIDTQDIDLFGLNIKEDSLISFFKEKGYPYKRFPVPNMGVFWNSTKTVKIDVYLNELTFTFKIPGPFTPSTQYTIPITQLFLSKLYYSDEKRKEKNQQDLITILRTHRIGKSEEVQTIQISILKDIWCCKTDSYTIFSFCEKKLIEILEICDDEPSVKDKIEYILEIIRKTPKKCPYKMGKTLHCGAPNTVEDAFLS